MTVVLPIPYQQKYILKRGWVFIIVPISFCICLIGVQANQIGRGGLGMELKITTAAFEEGGNIPKKYICDWPDISPPLS